MTRGVTTVEEKISCCCPDVRGRVEEEEETEQSRKTDRQTDTHNPGHGERGLELVPPHQHHAGGSRHAGHSPPSPYSHSAPPSASVQAAALWPPQPPTTPRLPSHAKTTPPKAPCRLTDTPQIPCTPQRHLPPPNPTPAKTPGNPHAPHRGHPPHTHSPAPLKVNPSPLPVHEHVITHMHTCVHTHAHQRGFHPEHPPLGQVVPDHRGGPGGQDGDRAGTWCCGAPVTPCPLPLALGDTVPPTLAYLERVRDRPRGMTMGINHIDSLLMGTRAKHIQVPPMGCPQHLP